MRTTIAGIINTGIARMAMLCLLSGLYTNFSLAQETVTDMDGNIYQTVVINGKVWTLSNYLVTRYADGTCIPSGLNNAEWAADKNGAYAIPPTGDAGIYGLLYNGYSVRNTSHGGIAVPLGWRIATDEDWQALEAYLGMASADLTISNWRASGSVGQKLKSITADWQAGEAGTDAVGFKALPAGIRAANGALSYANQRSAYWTPSEGENADPDKTYRRVITYNRQDIHRTALAHIEGMSIRLVKITTTPVELINYNLNRNFNSVAISWETVSEQDNDYFLVERSADGVNFNEIAKLPGKGTTNQRQTYSVTDYFPVNGINYYRLKQYDKNGIANNYGIKAVNFKLDNEVFVTVAPNPVVTGASITLSLTGYEGSKLSVRLIRLDGTVVQKWNDIVADNSQNDYLLNLNTKLVAGQYILYVQDNGFSRSAKLIVQ